jgi:ankyrin repeat protein
MAYFDPPPEENDLDRVLDKVADAFDKIKSLPAKALTPGAQASPDAQQLMIRAIKSKNRGAVETLLRAKPDLNAHDASGDTFLHHAARAGDASIITLLVEHGANPRRGQAANDAHLPITDAMNFGNVDACRALASCGGFLSEKEARLNPLHQAAEKGKTSIAAAFLDAGMDPNARTPSGSSALLIALFRGEEKITRLLLADDRVCTTMNIITNKTDARLRTSFMIACEKAPTDIVAAMIARGAALNARTADGATVFELAVSAEKFETAAAIIEANIDIHANNGRPALLHALCARKCARNPLDKAGLARLLILHGADTDATDRASGLTPLQAAITAQDGTDCLETLLRFQADPHRRSKDGRQAIHVAAQLGHAAAIDCLMRHGADANTREAATGRTPLLIALEKADLECVRVLLDGGADPFACGPAGESPQTLAQQSENPDIIQLVAESIARKQPRRPGHTPPCP